MNILGVIEDLQELYLCDENKLKVFSMSDTFKYTPKHTLVLEHSRGTESRINHLSLFENNNENLVVLLTHSGLAFVYFPENWARIPLKFDNFSEHFEDCSVWSCSLVDNLLAVGANTHQVNIWNLDTGVIQGVVVHSHNIPCIDFNKSGYLASTSIDTTVLVSKTRCTTLSCKTCTEWGWGVKWILRSGICEVTQLPKSNISNLHNRYKSNLPTNYFNQNLNVTGRFDVHHSHNFYTRLRERLEGLPSNSESDEESESIMNFDTTSQEDSDSELIKYLLIQTTKNSVHLIDPSLAKFNLGEKMHVLAVYVPCLEINIRSFSRLSLLYFIEEFSLCVIGNQFGPEVLFLRICKCKNDKSVLKWDYSFVMELNIVLDGKVIGLYVRNHRDYARVYALTETMSFYVFNISKIDVEQLINFRL